MLPRSAPAALVNVIGALAGPSPQNAGHLRDDSNMILERDTVTERHVADPIIRYAAGVTEAGHWALDMAPIVIRADLGAGHDLAIGSANGPAGCRPP